MEERWEQLLAEVRQNKTSSVNLRGWEIGTDRAAKLAQALKHNTKLQGLNLLGSSLGNVQCELLSNALRVNSTLTSLNVRLNGIEAAGEFALTYPTGFLQHDQACCRSISKLLGVCSSCNKRKRKRLNGTMSRLHVSLSGIEVTSEFSLIDP